MTTADADWIDRFAGLAMLPAGIRADLIAGSSVVALPAGTPVFAPGQSASNMLLLLLQGTVRVQQTSDTGREVLLLMRPVTLAKYDGSIRVESVVLGDFEVGDHAVAQRTDRAQILRSPAEHQLGVVADRLHPLHAVQRLDRHHRRFVQHDPAPDPVEQTHLVLGLKRGDCVRYGRLRQVQGPRRRRHMVALGHGDEDAQAFQGHD